MARKVKAKGGPLDGRTVLVHETQKVFTHHADLSGSYQVNQKTATWKPSAKAADPDSAPTETSTTETSKSPSKSSGKQAGA